jgi:hypothetical protein
MVRISPWLSTQRPGCGPDGGEIGLFSSGIYGKYPAFCLCRHPDVVVVNPELPVTIIADAPAPYSAFQIAARTLDDYADAEYRVRTGMPANRGTRDLEGDRT